MPSTSTQHETPRRGDGHDAPWTVTQGRHPSNIRIGRRMIERGFVTEEQLDAALEHQRVTGQRVGDTLVEMGAISSFDLASTLADHFGVPFVDLRSQPVDPAIAAVVSSEIAHRYHALAIDRTDGHLVVAIADTDDVFALDDLHVLTGEPILAVMADPAQIDAAIDIAFASDVEAGSRSVSEIEEGPIVALLSGLIEQAIDERASDVHIEPSSTHVSIRFRVDGVLHDISETPLSALHQIVSRVKVLGNLDIAQTRSPQDGRFSVMVHGRPIDVRVATLPTACGETIVLRLLDRTLGIIDFASLGFEEAELARYESAFRSPQGAIFVSGPTGSGKTSTLYATLVEINTRDKAIVSIEDPIEYQLDGIKQIQVNPRAQVTFPRALRSILRADPDVVFVGEVRDGETARIAVEASITGHLVFSTLHTTSAAAVPMRLVEMGVEPYLVASALTCVVAQRLARRLCEACAIPDDEADRELLAHLGATDELLEGATFRRAAGCPACHGTGYHGRRALYEVMTIDEEIGRLILGSAPTVEIQHAAVRNGMNELRAVALARVVSGQLSVDEMLRVIA